MRRVLRRGGATLLFVVGASLLFVVAVGAAQFLVARNSSPMRSSFSGAGSGSCPTLTDRWRWRPRAIWASLHALGLAAGWWAGAVWSASAAAVFTGAPHAVVAALTLVAYLACSLRDPGYVPRVGREPLREALLEHQPRCQFCAAPQRPRVKHCHDCHRCVRRLDHHCFWLGNCVGARTHRTFLLYLVLQNALLWWTCAAAAAGAFALAYASPPEPAAAGAAHVGRVLAACACALLCLLMGLAALVLLAFQCALIVRGETTWEHLRRDTLNAAAGLPPLVRPFDRGAARNILAFGGCIAQPPAPTVAALPVAPGAASLVSLPIAAPATALPVCQPCGPSAAAGAATR